MIHICHITKQRNQSSQLTDFQYINNNLSMLQKNESDLDVKDLAFYAADLALKGGACAKQWFRTNINIDKKKDSSPVSEADRNTEAMLRQNILSRFPHHGLLGEEYGKENTESEYVWSIDPIDGTRSFITGSPLWGTLVALLKHGNPIIGAVEIPTLNERWIAYAGGGCSFSDNRGTLIKAKVSTCTSLSNAKFYTTSPIYFDETEKTKIAAIIESVMEPRFGGDCYIYCLLASGFIDLVIESQLHPFDYLPLIPIIEEAGGIITDWQGKQLDMTSNGKVVAAATRELHKQALAILNEDN